MFGRSVTQREVKDSKQFGALVLSMIEKAQTNAKVAAYFGIRKGIETFTQTRTCRRCEGQGKYHDPYAHYHSNTGKFTGGVVTCKDCSGSGQWAAPDFQRIFEDVTTTRGAKKGGRLFRKSKPVDNEFSDLHAGRVYYVWRMARFHGGADVCMPMMADLATHGDPYVNELEVMASIMAALIFGTSMGAAARWGAALGHISYDQAARITGGLMTAQQGGPVHDGNKPEEEFVEML